MPDALLQEITERREYAVQAWADIRTEGAKDMQFVSGNPWDKEDLDDRKNRPTVAPEEMGQYFNAVINALRANPRGAKFSPTGNGANDDTARFYQNKAREIEYRSHAHQKYIIAAENAIQRSYGFIRVDTRYADLRSANQELWIDDFPDPDMVLPDPDAKSPDSSDMQYCFVDLWRDQREFGRKWRGLRDRHGLKFPEVSAFSGSHSDWIKGSKVLEAEYWEVQQTPTDLCLVEVRTPLRTAALRAQPPATRELTLLEDEIDQLPRGQFVITAKRRLRTVDVPSVKMRLTNGLEILHEQDWAGKYIPIVSCYGKILWVPENGQTKRKIMSMTRFGRDPWKSYCYACSQELEILGMVPKAPVHVWKGQLRGLEHDWRDAMHDPKAFLESWPHDEEGKPYPSPPERIEYTQATHLQALEIVKEGFRRAIQAAMGSNFLPTNAQRRNEKSGKALDKIEQMAAQGTYHFVDSYEGMIRRAWEIGEDLIDKIHDYRGETGVLEADMKARRVAINDPSNPEAISTQGDHAVTITTGPSSDSERDAADDFTETIVANLKMVAELCGPKVAAAVLANSIRMRNLGPRGEQLADMIEPPEFKAKDGEPPSPETVALQAQVQQLTQMLQQAAREKDTKVVELQGKVAIEKMKVDATSQDKAADREVKLAVAELSARTDRLALFLEESGLIGARAHVSDESAKQRLHERVESATDRAHELVTGALDHDRALDAAGQQAQIAASQAAAANQPAGGAEV